MYQALILDTAQMLRLLRERVAKVEEVDPEDFAHYLVRAIFDYIGDHALKFNDLNDFANDVKDVVGDTHEDIIAREVAGAAFDMGFDLYQHLVLAGAYNRKGRLTYQLKSIEPDGSLVFQLEPPF